MSPFAVDHRRHVCQLYRRALRCSLDWLIDRRKWRIYAAAIRSQFDVGRDCEDLKKVADLVQATERLLWLFRHPEPYIYPTAPGGTASDRESRVPLELVKHGYGEHLETH